jgi:formylglycine-generating enzyme required for sulfatase activity
MVSRLRRGKETAKIRGSAAPEARIVPMPSKPLAFLSYAHIDDEYHGGAISEFRKQLSLSVRVVAGLDFEIFQDREGIEWGQSWRETVDAALGEVRLLIPILTPSFFRSEECRRELQAFLDLEAAAGRNDLVLPIYYLESEVMENKEQRAEDKLASAVASHQYRDWRSLRKEPFTSPKVRDALEGLAKDINRALRRTSAPPRPIPTPKPPVPPQPDEPDDLALIQDGDFAPQLIVLPRGEFMMGSADGDSQALDDEKPQHRVRIDYRLTVGRYPVTFEEWDRYAEDEAWHRARHVEPYKPSDQGWGRGKRPVINVSWEDIQGYLRWLSGKTGHRYRLLSEAEWEYACRAGATTAYHVGSGITNYDANFGGKVGKTLEVGSYAPNNWGLYDMHGNVWEWVEDCLNESNQSYEAAPSDGSAWTSGDCSRRVLRGGSWSGSPEVLRSANRSWDEPDSRNDSVGFRVARTLSQSESVTS